MPANDAYKYELNGAYGQRYLVYISFSLVDDLFLPDVPKKVKKNVHSGWCLFKPFFSAELKSKSCLISTLNLHFVP